MWPLPEAAAGFTHTCHPSPAPAAQPPALQNTNIIPMAALWSHSKLTCYNLAVLLRTVCLGGMARFGGSSPPDEMFLPTKWGLRCIHRLDQQLLWSKLDVANLPTKQNKETPISLVPKPCLSAQSEPRSFHCNHYLLWGNDVIMVVFSLRNTA